MIKIGRRSRNGRKKRNQKEKLLYHGLLAEMARYGDTNQTLAELLGITNSSVGRRISGEVQWSIDEVNTICYYYDKDYYELFT